MQEKCYKYVWGIWKIYLHFKTGKGPYLLRPTLVTGSLTLVNFKAHLFLLLLSILPHSQFPPLHHVIWFSILVLSLSRHIIGLLSVCVHLFCVTHLLDCLCITWCVFVALQSLIVFFYSFKSKPSSVYFLVYPHFTLRAYIWPLLWICRSKAHIEFTHFCPVFHLMLHILKSTLPVKTYLFLSILSFHPH